MKAYTLKMRGGVEIDSKGKRAGKGALIQEELSATLGQSNDQYLFQPIVLDDQGGQQISVRTDGKAPTLRAETHGNVPCVVGLDLYNQTITGGVACTLRAKNADFPCVMYENHSQDSRYKGPLKVAQTVSATYGMGGNNQPLIVQSVDFSHADDVARVSDTVPALQQRCHKGGNCVMYCIEGNGSRESHRGDGYAETETMYTLNTIERHAVVVLDRAAFNQGANAQYDFHAEVGGAMPTIVAKGPGAVAYAERVVKQAQRGSETSMSSKDNFMAVIGEDMAGEYIVRRLTPTECARLQGFPDKWGEIDHKEDFTDEEYKFWLGVRTTHAKINGKQVKEWTKPQMLTWYNKLHTDSAEYKMWGNGIALPNALYVMEGIAKVGKERE